MLIAIDHGNSAIKTVHYNFVAGLSRHSVRPPMADEVLEYNGSYWTLSGQRQAYQRDKTRDESYFILTLFAIAKEMLHAGSLPSAEKIDLAVGLPPEHYGILRDKFKQYFKRTESIQFMPWIYSWYGTAIYEAEAGTFSISGKLLCPNVKKLHQ